MLYEVITLGAVERDVGSLEQAISLASRITDEAIETAGSFGKWQEMGNAALVYDRTGLMVWDGIVETIRKYGNTEE